MSDAIAHACAHDTLTCGLLDTLVQRGISCWHDDHDQLRIAATSRFMSSSSGVTEVRCDPALRIERTEAWRLSVRDIATVRFEDRNQPAKQKDGVQRRGNTTQLISRTWWRISTSPRDRSNGRKRGWPTISRAWSWRRTGGWGNGNRQDWPAPLSTGTLAFFPRRFQVLKGNIISWGGGGERNEASRIRTLRSA